MNKDEDFKNGCTGKKGVKQETKVRKKAKGTKFPGVLSMHSKTVKRALDRTKKGNKWAKRKTSVMKCGCTFQINLFVAQDDYWYISQRSNLHHTGHPKIPSSANFLGSNNISETDSAFISMCNDAGVSNSQIAKMLALMHGRESGTFLPQTLYNYSTRTKKMCDLAKGIKPDMTDAEKALQLLRA